MRIGIDAGGTFTDFVVLDGEGRLSSFKIRSNPRNPAAVILEGIERVAGGLEADIVHGSTVATNALLERKGAPTAFVTTAGFEDIMHIGRQNRPELYNLMPALRRPLIDRSLCFGLRERTYYDGRIGVRPSPTPLGQLRRKLLKAGVRSVALCFLHAYQNSDNERVAGDALRSGFYLSCSHETCPEFREYERASTTLINAYVGPLMDAYLGELEQSGRRFWILQSNGGFMTAGEARRHAVRTVLSGPAGGVTGAVEMARLSGFERVLGFDMGGTSTDVSVCDGESRETMEASIDGFPVRVPMLDIHTVGAGGGSIARLDEGGLLRVGPESAGADPGPACCGAGQEATVTDAHVVLGRISARQFLGGEMELDLARAEAAVDRLAQRMGLERAAAAAGMLRVANANMERAVRAVSVERGHDPRRFALVAFGGCGGLHACELAAALGIRTVLSPACAGALSALGMLLADRIRDYAAGVLGGGDIERRFRSLERAAQKDLPGAATEHLADIRYQGQSYEITVPWNPADPAAPFHAEHHRIYGYSNPARAVEVVTVRLRARIVEPKPKPAETGRPESGDPETRRIFIGGAWRRTPVLQRAGVGAKGLPGPVLILDYGSTTLVPPGWSVARDGTGNLLIRSQP